MKNLKYGYGYVRVSTDKQDELSPDSQEKLLKEYAKKNDIIITKVYYEIGVSGRKADKRPEFQRMIASAKSKEHPVDAILVWKFSRFARNQEESIVYKSLLKKKHNVDVLSVSEPLVDGPFGSLIERIIEWMDEYYSIRLSGEVTRGMTEKALRGGYQARPPLGYKIVDRGKPPVIVPEEAQIVKIIFDMYATQKHGMFDIARYLNSLGFKTSRGKTFERRSIEYIIQNPTYCGMIRWNRTENETNRIKDKREWIITEGNHDAIISKELFDMAQERFNSTYSPRGERPSSTYRHWLSGVVKCPSCGRTMVAKHTIDKHSGKEYCYFTCYGYSKGKCAAKTGVSSLKLEPAVLQSIEKILKTKRISYKYMEPEEDQDIDEHALLEEQLRKNEEKAERIKLAYMNGVDSLEEYKHNKSLIQDEHNLITKQLSDLSAPEKKDYTSQMLTRINSIYDLLTSENTDMQTKNELLKNVVERIVYNREKDKLKIYYYYKP